MNKLSFKQWILPMSLVASLFVFSCAKEPSGVRTIKKTESQVVNPAVSGPSITASQQQGLDFAIATLEHLGNSKFKSEIKTNTGRYIPVTTEHSNGQEATGLINVEDNAQSKLDIRSGCFEDCKNYVLLVTVIQNNMAVLQIAAMSREDKDFFYVEHINSQVSPSSLYRGTTSLTPVQQIHEKYKATLFK